MIVLTGGEIVLPDRRTAGSLFIERDRIAAVDTTKSRVDTADASIVDVTGHLIVPGFIDVHVHGVDGHDTLDEGDALGTIALRLIRYGVTAFCPTTVACSPIDLRRFLNAVSQARYTPSPRCARVMPAHLESNFINPEYRGAQPPACLRKPFVAHEGSFSGQDILGVIAAFRADVGIVTLAPELPGGLDLVRHLVEQNHRVSLGHSGATFEQAIAAIDAGAHHATHLFNRMSPIAHRAPGLAGAVLSREDVTAELICDGHHVHPAMCRTAIAAKGLDAIVAITDGTAGAGLPPGSKARLGGQTITVHEHAALLADGTLAGSTLTMDRAFRMIVNTLGMSVVEAARLCATTPARKFGLGRVGVIEEGAAGDVVVLDQNLEVARTFISGREVYARSATA